MTVNEVMAELEAFGAEQTRKTYQRHGVSGEMFGVSYAHLGKLQKRIKVDHALALGLWATGNHDARVLATMIADPAQADDKALEGWAKELDSYVITDAVAKYVAASPLVRQKAEKWTKSKQEWIGAAGWVLLAQLAMKDATLTDDYFEPYLLAVENDIHKSKNRVRHAMNGAVIAVGVRNPKLQKRAIAAAKKIGKVEVDHGATNCKTPDAAEYILKTAAHRRSD